MLFGVELILILYLRLLKISLTIKGGMLLERLKKDPENLGKKVKNILNLSLPYRFKVFSKFQWLPYHMQTLHERLQVIEVKTNS